jgi:hypothetical protein
VRLLIRHILVSVLSQKWPFLATDSNDAFYQNHLKKKQIQIFVNFYFGGKYFHPQFIIIIKIPFTIIMSKTKTAVSLWKNDVFLTQSRRWGGEESKITSKISRCNICGQFFDSKKDLKFHKDKSHRISDTKIKMMMRTTKAMIPVPDNQQVALQHR